MSSKAIPPSRKRVPSFPERANVKIVHIPLIHYPYWVKDIQQKAIYYHTTVAKMEYNIERLKGMDPNKNFEFCPKYIKECQNQTAN